jgi:SWI/SNF-related matrix-associated actin-dependent regulator of chromatin subfamily A containing DEAD/H box 1
VEDLNDKLGQGKKKAGPAGISARMFDDCRNIFKEYGAVDSILDDCERIGSSLRSIISSWTVGALPPAQNFRKDSNGVAPIEDGALTFTSLGQTKKNKGFLSKQPKLVSESVQLKEYQLLGVNWLNLLYTRDLSCILADEMGENDSISSPTLLICQFHRTWQDCTGYIFSCPSEGTW